MRGKSKGNQFCFELAGNSVRVTEGSSYRGSTVVHSSLFSRCMALPLFFSFLRFLHLSVKNFDF